MSVNNTKKPLILKRMILKGPGKSIKTQVNPGVRNMNNQLIKLATIPLYREDVIFESKDERFIPGEYRSITISNKLNNITNNCTTIARCITHDDEIIEKTSVNVTQLIGQESYNTVFYALCSVINPEYRIKGILSLLTALKEETKEAKDKSPEDPLKITPSRRMGTDKSCQTDETRIDTKKRPRKRIRKVLVPYVIKPQEPQIRKITVDPYARDSSGRFMHINKNKQPDLQPTVVKTESIDTENLVYSRALDTDKNTLPDLGYLRDDSNVSEKSYSTLHTFKTISDLLINPISLVKSVDEHTKEQLILPNYSIMLTDGKVIHVPFKPEDDLHIATKENLLYLSDVNRRRLLLHQMQIDYKHCLRLMDEDGNLPIHLAVINDDLELLKRQCVVLKIRSQSLDIPAKNNLTALKLSIFRESSSATSVLLDHGADPLLADAEHSTCTHLAAELRTDHLPVILHHCKLNARNIIIHHAEELQTPDFQNKTDEELANILLHHICTLYDKQGYNPLMLASKMGHYENVRLLLERAPQTVQLTMPTSGSTALFLAVSAACTKAAESANQSKITDHFRKTIEILLENGADPTIENHNGVNVPLVLQDFHCVELSMLIANKVTCIKYFKGEEDHTKNFDKYILMKEGNTVSIQDINCTQKTLNKVIKTEDTTIKEDIDLVNAKKVVIKDLKGLVTKEIKEEKVIKKECDQKPVITENILIKTPIKVQKKPNSTPIIENKVNSVDFVVKPTYKITNVSTIKKVIWTPQQASKKRKNETNKDNVKRSKNT